MPGAPNGDAGEKEQPHHLNKMPIPCGRFKTEFAFRPKLSGKGLEENHDQEDRADEHVHSVKAGRHEEDRTVDVTGKLKCRVAVFVGLAGCEEHTEQNCQREAPDQALAVTNLKRMMRPSD